ncbi:endonuclease/exonuclease/phosphatase family protein, partial [Toxoplasma gondii GAB2-2007-GAL-DOM2]
MERRSKLGDLLVTRAADGKLLLTFFWLGQRVNLERSEEEPLDRLLQRLRLSCRKVTQKRLAEETRKGKAARKQRKKAEESSPGAHAATEPVHNEEKKAAAIEDLPFIFLRRCPVLACVVTEHANEDDLVIEWRYEDSGADGPVIHRGRHYTPKPADEGRVLILKGAYARTPHAVQAMYPYCSGHHLDLHHRKALLGKELHALDGDIVALQECSSSLFFSFLAPLFKEEYHAFLQCKFKARVQEGCALLIRKKYFSVLREGSVIFQKELLTNPQYDELLAELRRKWPHFE